MTKTKHFIYIVLLLIIFTLTVDASAEIRGTKATGTASWNAQNFAGFWYDIDSDKSTESLVVSGSISDRNRFIDSGNLQYNTFVISIPFKLYTAKGFTVDGKSSYYAVGWQGQRYLAVNGKANKLTKLVLEQESSDSKVLSVGQTWDMGDGYTLTAQSIDARASPRQAWLVFSKDGKKLDDKVIAQGQVYSYSENVGGEMNVPVFVTYINNIYPGTTSDVIELKYSWLISKSIVSIKTSDKYGIFKVSSANDNNIALINEVGVTLQKGSRIDLIGGLKFEVADNDRLIYYPVIRLQDEYTIRGELAKGAASWNAQNFAGFWYDLDSDQSTETLSLSGSITNANRYIETKGLTYRTSAVPVNYIVSKTKGLSVDGKVSYKAVGWQGDKYIAINGKSNKLTKILLEQGESASEKKTLTIGETWNMGFGYTLTAQSIDAKASPRQAWLVLSKDGKKLDDKVVSQGQIYTYEAYFGEEGYVPILVTYLDSVFAGATSDMVQLRYTLLASDSPLFITTGDRFGVFEVTGSNSDSVVLANKNRISLSSGIVSLTSRLKFKVANDALNLRFYPVIDNKPSSEASPLTEEAGYTPTVPPSPAITVFPKTSVESKENWSIYILVIVLGIILVYILKPRKSSSKEDKPKPSKPVEKEIKPEISKPVKTENTYTLIIEVKSAYNKTPVQKASVTLEPIEGGSIERISDIDGKVIFGKVKEGHYKLRVIFKGFEEESKGVEVTKNDRIIIELKGKATIDLSVFDLANERPLTDAEIKLGEMSFKTDERGNVSIPNISYGRYSLSVHKDSYKTEELTFDVNEAVLNKKIYLKTERELSGEFAATGGSLKHSLNESMKKLSSACDMGIPEYYRSVCDEIIRLIEAIATNSVYVDADSSNEKIYALYLVAENICKEIGTILTNEENITDYINMGSRGHKKISVATINLADYAQMIYLFMTNPKEFIDKNKKDIFNKLQLIDREITNNVQNYHVSPIANLWQVSQKLMQNETKNETQEAASLVLVNILLNKTREMFRNEEIIKRIRK